MLLIDSVCAARQFLRGQVQHTMARRWCVGALLVASMASPVASFVLPHHPGKVVTHRNPAPLWSRSRQGAFSSRPQPRFVVDPSSLSQEVMQQQAGRGLLALIQPLAAQLSQTPLLKAFPVVVGVLAATLLAIRLPIIAGWRSYSKESNSVGREYDAWTREKILEYYWGEHIHLGYYSDEEQKQGYLKKDFIGAKYDFIDQMMSFARLNDANKPKPAKVLDVGCGIGGTSRYIAKKLGTGTEVSGITLSSEQVKRATELAEEQQVPNAKFAVMDALKMEYPDNSFDLVWACESGEHMPDKKAYVEEMVRVLKPGGTLVIACWCQRDNATIPFTPAERRRVDFMCTEWSHPYFISIKNFGELVEGTGVMESIRTDNWAKYTLPSWRHSIWVGIFDPIFWITRPHLWLKCARDAFTLNVFHNAFKDGLMGYGMIYGTKKKAPAPAAAAPSA